MYLLYAVHAIQHQISRRSNGYKKTSLTDGLRVGLHLLLGEAERSAVIEMQVHLSLDVQNNLSGLKSESERVR